MDDLTDREKVIYIHGFEEGARTIGSILFDATRIGNEWPLILNLMPHYRASSIAIMAAYHAQAFFYRNAATAT